MLKICIHMAIFCMLVGVIVLDFNQSSISSLCIQGGGGVCVTVTCSIFHIIGNNYEPIAITCIQYLLLVIIMNLHVHVPE